MLAAPDVLARFRALHIDVVTGAPDELRRLQIREIAERSPLIEALGLIQN